MYRKTKVQGVAKAERARWRKSGIARSFKQVGNSYRAERGKDDNSPTPPMVARQITLINTVVRLNLLVDEHPGLSSVESFSRRPKLSSVSELDMAKEADVAQLRLYIDDVGQCVQVLSDYPEVGVSWKLFKTNQSLDAKVSAGFVELGLNQKAYAAHEEASDNAKATMKAFAKEIKNSDGTAASRMKAMETRDASLLKNFAELKFLACLYLQFPDLPQSCKNKLNRAGKGKVEIREARAQILLSFKKEVCKAYMESLETDTKFNYGEWLEAYAKG